MAFSAGWLFKSKVCMWCTIYEASLSKVCDALYEASRSKVWDALYEAS